MAKLKTFLLNHGEKLAFGLCAMLALLVLAGTSWSTYERTPAQLVTAADAGKKAIADSVWPEEEKTKLAQGESIIERSRDMLVGINISEFEPSTELFVPVYERSQPINEPKFFTVDKPLAKPGVVMIEQAPPLADDALLAAGEDPENPTDAAEEELPAGFRTKKPAAGDPNSAFGESAYSDPLMVDTPGEMMSPDMYMTGEMGQVAKTLYGEGYRFIAVRAILDLMAQKNEMAKALNLSTSEASRMEPVILGFEIERQKARPGNDLWSGPWVKLDIQNSIDVLEKAAYLEAEPIDPTLTIPSLTSPLAGRIIGEWGTYALHPAIENFKLSAEEQAREQARIDLLLKMQTELEKSMGPMGQPAERQPGGFSGMVRNVRGAESMMGEMYASGNSEYTDVARSYEASYAEEMNAMGMAMPAGNARGQVGGSLLVGKRSPASGRLLLFRYFDFDVEPGAAYRYRVRIEYENPNFGRRIDTLAAPEFAEGFSRFSDWSEPTQAEASEGALVSGQQNLSDKGAVVLPDAEYFLTNVKVERGYDSPVADLDIFQWSTQYGSELHQPMRLSVGDSIGGEAETKVVNLLESTYDVTKVNLRTSDYVVDLYDNSKAVVDRNLPGLTSVPADVRLDQAVVLNRQAELKVIDPITNNARLRDAKKRVSLYATIGKQFEEAAKKASSVDSLLGGEEMYMMEGMPSRDRKSRRANAASIRGNMNAN